MRSGDSRSDDRLTAEGWYGAYVRNGTPGGLSAISEILLVVSTIVLGVVVAGAPLFGPAERLIAVNLGLIVWVACGMFFLVSLATGVAGTDVRGFERGVEVTGVAAMTALMITACSLFLARTLHDRPALTWNVDWRYALSHAQAIGRTGGLENSLDYAGVAIDYHAGPSWLAGLWHRAFDNGLTEVLFGVAPAASVVAVGAALVVLLTGLGLSRRLGVLAAFVALLLPWGHVIPYYEVLTFTKAVSNEDIWAVGSSLMLNSYFGLAVGLAAMALLLHPGGAPWRLALGAIGLAALIGLKPQYFLGLGLLAALIALVRVLPLRWTPSGSVGGASRESWHIWALLGLLVALPSPLAKIQLSATVEAFLGAVAFGAILLGTRLPGAGGDGVRGAAWLLAAGGSLLLALSLLKILPTMPVVVTWPTWMPGETGWKAREYFSTSTLLFVAATGFLVHAQRCTGLPDAGRLLALARMTLIAIAIIVSLLQLFSVPLRPDLMEQGMRLGGFKMYAGLQQFDFSQSQQPLQLVLLAVALGVILQVAAIGSRRLRGALLVSVAGLIALRVAVVTTYIAEPGRGYEVVDDADLRRVLAAVPIEQSLLISSDLADPAQDYARPANGSRLVAYGGHAFYVAEFRYINWTRPNAVERLDALRMFFGSHWAPWHDAWLRARGVTHVLASERCRPVWADDANLPLTERIRSGGWVAFEVRPRTELGDASALPAWRDLEPRFGRSECLLLRRKN